MQRISLLLGMLIAFINYACGREFTVMVYNVENLFDLDGVALYPDYEQGRADGYGRGPLLKKLEGIHRMLATFNDGNGPEVVMFQELELDRTPFGQTGAGEFLRATAGKRLEELLEDPAWERTLPSHLLLLKYLEDRGMTGYSVALADPEQMEYHPAHVNAVFSRFPIRSVRQRPLLDARDLLVVEIDVDGRELVLLDNHWKSGASNASTEVIRVQNAHVVRAEVESILYRNPQADVIIAGDLNSYYNHKAAFPDLPETGVNDVLRANGYETRMQQPGSRNLYNLWFELDPEERGSEVYRGYWGTLIQMILTPGLYDESGIQYVDNSFNRLAIPGMNVEPRWSRPIRWTNYGGGAGFSDHLPVYARFQTVEIDQPGEWMPLEDPSEEAPSAWRPSIDFRKMNRMAVPDVSALADLTPAERAARIGELFRVDVDLSAAQPPKIRVGDLELELYSPIRPIRDKLRGLGTGDRIRCIADLDVYRGRLQLVVRDGSWLEE